jgi:[acyl-carrier-protein] S-malonyltransferase
VIAFIFPGQGSQKVGMGRALADASPACRAVFDEADAALGESLSRVCFEGPAEQLTMTEYTQPAILTVSVAAARLLAERGIQPDVVAGHSLGEYSAHVTAGTFAFGDAVRIVRRRGTYMQQAVPLGEGAMAALLGGDLAAIEQACAEAAAGGGVVSPANLNAPGQVVIAGSRDAVARAVERAKALGVRRAVPLPVSAPFHCAADEAGPGAARPGAARAARHTTRGFRSWRTSTPSRRRNARPTSIEALVAQVSAPVLWEAVVRRLIGARRAHLSSRSARAPVLSGLVIRKIDPSTARWRTSRQPDQLEAVEAHLPRGIRRNRDCRSPVAMTTCRTASPSSPARRAASAAPSPGGLPLQGALVVAAARGDHAHGTAEAITVRLAGAPSRADARRDRARTRSRAAVAGDPRAPRAHRHPRQQRGHHARPAAAAHEARRLGRRARHQPHRHLRAHAGGAEAHAPAARAAGSSSISSVVGQMGNAGQANYAASKAGLIGFTQVGRARGRLAPDHGERRRARASSRPT